MSVSLAHFLKEEGSVNDSELNRYVILLLQVSKNMDSCCFNNSESSS